MQYIKFTILKQTHTPHQNTPFFLCFSQVLSDDFVNKQITDFKGKRVAIDASSWLHKGVFASVEVGIHILLNKV